MNKNEDYVERQQNEKNVAVYTALVNKQKEQSIMRARIIGVKPNSKGVYAREKWYAVAEISIPDFDEFNVIIPAFLMGFDDIEDKKDKAGNPISENDKYKLYRSYIFKMINAEIDFVIYDSPIAITMTDKVKLILGDRITAMKKLQNSYYFKNDKNGKSNMERRFEADEKVPAKVITITDNTVIVDVCGYIGTVIAREVSWRYTEDLHNVVRVGEAVHVKFLDLKINKEDKTIEATLSIKAATPNKMLENMNKFTEGSTLLGKVSGERNGGFYVQVGNYNNGIDVYCKKINTFEVPHKNDKVAVQLYKFDYEKGRIYGSIDAIVEKGYSSYINV